MQPHDDGKNRKLAITVTAKLLVMDRDFYRQITDQEARDCHSQDQAFGP